MGFTESLLCRSVCLAFLLTTFLSPVAHGGPGKAQGWGKGGKKQYTISSATTENNAPTIGGVPATSVAEDSAYLFQPSASDADGDSLTFSIQNRPVWASFNSGTGRLSGTPGNNDVGSYGSITITVSDGSSSASLAPFSITVTNTNDAPSISGTPSTSVEQGSSYNFQPVAGDPDGDSLSFSIENRPAWAAFSTSTGRLYGAPDAADIGSYENIRITVSDGTVDASLAAFSISVNGTTGQTGSVSLSWTAPTQRTDGTPMSIADLAGYTVDYGPSEGNYTSSIEIDDPVATSVVVTDLPAGVYYFALKARDTVGQESAYSAAVSKQIQ
ncbi:MAG: putative Ig domain-containing protein [Gammaproteobacteria bacterium]